MNRQSPEAWLPITPLQPPPPARSARDPWRALLFVVFKWLPHMAAIVAVGLVLGAGYLVFLRGDLFQANAKLFVRVGVDQTPSPVLGYDRNVTFLAQTRGAVQSEMDLLRNEVLVQKLIADLNLGAPEPRPEAHGLFGYLKRLGADTWRAVKDVTDAGLVAIGLKTPLSREAAFSQTFQQSLILDNAVNSDVISVSLRWPDKAQAAVVLDRFLAIYTSLRAAVFQGGEEVEFLSTKRDAARAAVEAIEAEMSAFERAHDIRNAAARAPLMEADRVEAQRAQERAALDLGLARRRLERLDKGLATAVSGGGEPLGLGAFPANSPALGMAASIVSLLGERERLLVNNSPQAPDVKENEAKLRALMVVLRQQLDAEAQDALRAQTVADERLQRVETALRDLQDSATGWKTLERRHDLAEQRYRDAEKRLAEARDIGALRNARLSNVVVVQPAAVEGVPIGMRKLPMLGVIAVCAAVMAAGYALVREMFDGKLYQGRVAADALGLAYIGETPDCADPMRDLVLARGDDREAKLALDRLTVVVDELLRAARASSLAVVAADPGEGATTVAVALAGRIAARRGSRVLLLGGGADRTFAECVGALALAGPTQPRAETFADGWTVTDFGERLVCGTWPSETGVAQRLPDLIAPGGPLRDPSDLVVVDLQSVSADPETPFAAGRIGPTLIVACAERRTAAVHQDAIETLRRQGAEPIGLVLNRVRPVVPRALDGRR